MIKFFRRLWYLSTRKHKHDYIKKRIIERTVEIDVASQSPRLYAARKVFSSHVFSMFRPVYSVVDRIRNQVLVHLHEEL